MVGETPVTYETRGACAVITIVREKAMNALNEPAREAIKASLLRSGADDGVGAVILTGAGERAFCAGQDIREAIGFDGERGRRWAGELRDLYRAVRSFEKPVVAAVNGVAAGLGFQLAMMADIRVAAAHARMGQTEIDVGLPGITGPWIMREVMGLSHTIEMTLSGRLLDVEECRSLGLVNDIAPTGALMETAMERARALAAKPRGAVALTKRRIWELLEPGFQETAAAAERLHAQAFASGTPQKVMREFLNARGKNMRRE